MISDSLLQEKKLHKHCRESLRYMKKFIKKIWDATIKFVKWIWSECKSWKTLLLFGVVCLVLGAPVWVCALIGLLFHWEWAIVAAAALWAFWMLPGVPFFALSLSLTLGIKRIFETKMRKKNTAGEPEKDKNDESAESEKEQQ